MLSAICHVAMPARLPGAAFAFFITAITAFLSVPQRIVAASGPEEATAESSDDDGAAESHQAPAVARILRDSCVDCHGSDTQEASVRLDTIDLSGRTPQDRKTVQTVKRMIDEQRMPPEDAGALSDADRQFLSRWLDRQLTTWAEADRRSGRNARMRRLTVAEYNHTMQHLFGVDAQFTDRLTPDPVSPEGYRNSAELLGLSSLQIECYLETARSAVARYVLFGEPAESPLRYFIELEDLYYSTADRYGTRDRAPEPVDWEEFRERQLTNRRASPDFVGPLTPLPPGPFPTEEPLREAIPKLHQQFVAFPKFPTSGEMVVRIRAAATPSRSGRYPRMRVETGITLGDGDWMDTRMLGEVDVKATRDQPAVYEFRYRMEDVPTKGHQQDEEVYDRLSVFDLNQLFISNVTRDERAIYDLGRGGYRESEADQVAVPLKTMAEAGLNALYLDSVEVEVIPGVTAKGPYRWSIDPERYAGNPGDPKNAAQQRRTARDVLTRFLDRAYRRPAHPSEVDSKLTLFDQLRDAGASFEDALRETMAATLVSPAFLFHEYVAAENEKPGSETTPYQLASRLSYLLWLEPPDARLRELAEDDSICDSDVLVSEATRMLDDPKAERFLRDFCRQWLRLDRLRNVAVDTELYPQYDQDLIDLAVEETLRYFVQVFSDPDASALDLLDSDYLVLNERLARHYGIDSVIDGSFAKVALPAGSSRGGLLTQASLLTMNSDGRDSHPIRRGVWLLDRLLGTPPPPPPPNVPEIDSQSPELEGLSLKQQIEMHRDADACRSCHASIDPWGIPFENFDATGRWRSEVFAAGPAAEARPVDASAELPSGERIEGIRELKRYLVEQRRDDFANSLVRHMYTYAMGRAPAFGDQPSLKDLHDRFAGADYRLKTLVLAIIESEGFRQ